MQSIILEDCKGLCPISPAYKVWALYVWMGGGTGKAVLVCMRDPRRERERLVALINTCGHSPWISHQMLRCQPNIGLWDWYPCSVNHGPTLNCSPMCKCIRHLIKALWWQGAHAKSRNVYSVLHFEMRTCTPLVCVRKMRESTAATK